MGRLRWLWTLVENFELLDMGSCTHSAPPEMLPALAPYMPDAGPSADCMRQHHDRLGSPWVAKEPDHHRAVWDL